MFTLPGWHLFGSKYRYPLNSVEIIYKKAVQKDSKKIFPLCKQKKKKKHGYPSITTVVKLTTANVDICFAFQQKKLIHSFCYIMILIMWYAPDKKQ